jgi:cobalamin-dependent methionine synthase I
MKPHSQNHVIAENLHSRAPALMHAFRARDFGPILACARLCALNDADRLDLSPGSGAQAAEIMAWAVPLLCGQVGLPLSLDSPDAAVIVAGASVIPDDAPAPLVNSVWNSPTRLARLIPLASERGWPVMGLCMDARPPTTASERIEQARLLVDAVCKLGLAPEDLWLDALSLPHAFDLTQARACLEAVQVFTQVWPQNRVALAVSNVGFGFRGAARTELQRAFLLLARASGADTLIADLRDPLTAAILRDERPDLDRLAAARLANQSSEINNMDDALAIRLWERMGALLDGR